jgi:uncharacterized protein
MSTAAAPAPGSASVPGTRLNPVNPTERIHAIDAVRGLALLGILLVNMATFSDAFGEMIKPKPPADLPAIDLVAFYVVKIFCEGKFYPLFSLLFGIGLTLQFQRARQSGRRFYAAGFRRLAFIGFLGVLHAALLWYGDILFFYGTAGVALLLLSHVRIRTQVIVASIVLALAVLLGMVFATFIDKPPPEPPVAAAATATTEPIDPRPCEGLMQQFKTNPRAQDPSGPEWIDAERRAYREGPYDQLFKFRLMTWGMFLIFASLGFWWHVLAMFLYGAALVRAGLFSPEKRRWHARFLTLGLVAGLPLCAIGALGPRFVSEQQAMLLYMPTVFIGGPLLSLAYVSAITLLVHSGRLKPLTRALAATGRMALTNYLTQTVVCTTIFYFYGLGLFAQVSHAQRIAIALSIWLAQIGLSLFWLSYFRYGPMEWLWRTATYLRPQPLLIRPATGSASPAS